MSEINQWASIQRPPRDIQEAIIPFERLSDTGNIFRIYGCITVNPSCLQFFVNQMIFINWVLTRDTLSQKNETLKENTFCTIAVMVILDSYLTKIQAFNIHASKNKSISKLGKHLFIDFDSIYIDFTC